MIYSTSLRDQIIDRVAEQADTPGLKSSPQ
jgi:hypothetical protein